MKESYVAEGETVVVSVAYLQSVRRMIHNHKRKIDEMRTERHRLALEIEILKDELARREAVA